MIAAVVLGAGESRRMGRSKLLLSYSDSTVIEHIVETLVASGIQDITVVLGHEPDAVRRALTGQPVRLVINEDYAQGMLSSVRAGLREVRPENDAVLIVLGDQPSLKRGWLEALHASFQAARGGIHVPVYNGRRGHPLLLATQYIPEILTGFETEGLRGLVRKHRAALHEVPVADEAVLADMDTPEDYARELGRLPAHGAEESETPDNHERF